MHIVTHTYESSLTVMIQPDREGTSSRVTFAAVHFIEVNDFLTYETMAIYRSQANLNNCKYAEENQYFSVAKIHGM